MQALIDQEQDFRVFERGVDVYKDVSVIQGPLCHNDEYSIRSYGAKDAQVMFIGIGPARDETERTKRPLTGPSGELLDDCLTAIGLRRQDMYVTNMSCTWVQNITGETVKSCRSRLELEIQTLKPKFIILLGKDVSEIITGRPFAKVRGAVQWYENWQCYVMGTYHSAAIYRALGEYGSEKDDKASKYIYDFIRDLRKISLVLEWGPGAPEAQIRYRVVDSIEQAQNVLDNLPRSEDYPITVDVETDYSKEDEKVEIWQTNLLCVGVGSDNYCWVFTPRALYNEDGTPALNWPPDVWWTMQNAIYDSQVVRLKLGQWINIYEDPMLQSYSLEERSGIHGLKPMAREYLGAGFYEEERYKGKVPLAKLPKEKLYEYNARDCIYSTRLCVKYRQWQIDDNVRDFYKRLLIAPLNMYKETQFHGVDIDLNMRDVFLIKWGSKIIELDNEIEELIEEIGWIGEFNSDSTQQLGVLLYELLGLPCQKFTKTGAKSTDKEALKALEGQHPIIDLIQTRRSYKKMFSTYIEELPEKLKGDGRAHPEVKLHGTVTGRPAYEGLAIQTFVAPTDPREFNQLRHLVKVPTFTGYEGTDGYIPPKDDRYVLVEVDVGKAELWQAYGYSRDPQMLEDLLSGDYHRRVGGDIYNKPIELVTGDERGWAKRTTFGILYLVEEVTLGKLTNSTPLEARIRIKRWGERNKVYTKWSLDTQKQILRTGELTSKTDRKRRIIILGNAHRAAKQAVNFPIQSTSSDVVLDSAVRMHPKLKAIGGHILFTVHDSIVTKALLSRLEEHVKIMHDEMIAEAFPGVVAMPVEVKIGTTWGNVKGVHDCAESPTHKENIGNNPYSLNMGGHCLYDYYRNTLGVAI